jgi:hypothetical protein
MAAPDLHARGQQPHLPFALGVGGVQVPHLARPRPPTAAPPRAAPGTPPATRRPRRRPSGDVAGNGPFPATTAIRHCLRPWCPADAAVCEVDAFPATSVGGHTWSGRVVPLATSEQALADAAAAFLAQWGLARSTHRSCDQTRLSPGCYASLTATGGFLARHANCALRGLPTVYEAGRAGGSGWNTWRSKASAVRRMVASSLWRPISIMPMGSPCDMAQGTFMAG